MRTALQEVLEAEMTEAVGAGEGRAHRRAGKLIGRAITARTLITRVGRLELRVPQDRAERFSTELFERYQRSERALVAALAEMYVQSIGLLAERDLEIIAVVLAALPRSGRPSAFGNCEIGIRSG